MAKKSNYVGVSAGDFSKQLSALVAQYGKEVQAAVPVGIMAAAEELKAELVKATPEDTGKTKKAYKVQQPDTTAFITNTRMVQGKTGKVNLLNILEYSTRRGRPFVRKTITASQDKMVTAFVDAVNDEMNKKG